MSEYLHGAYGKIQPVGNRVADTSLSAIVYVGTAPVHTLEGGASKVNKPILVNNIAEARNLLGYSEDWAKFTLCEAMHAHLVRQGVGPLIFINVLDPTVHKSSEATTSSLTPANGRITVANAESIILDTVTVAAGQTAKVKGTDYSISYNSEKKVIVISELSAGSLGSSALTVSYYTIDATAVTASTVIGSSDGAGLNTGLYAVKNVYQETGHIPAFLAAPGFSSIPAVHTAMGQISANINGHWTAYLFADLPIVHNDTAVTLATAATWKASNGYNLENETVYFPLAEGVDGKIYHLSVLAAANFQSLLLEQDGIPWRTASNTACPVIQNLYLGAAAVGRVYDDTLINEKLCKNGIASAAFVGGRWVIWGCHSADYSAATGDPINVAETNRMMLYYICNDFQHRRPRNVDKPMSANDLQSILSEEQTRLDALLKIGALTYGEVHLNASAEARSDIMQGDYSFVFNVTTTPLAKSLTAIVNWTDEGFVAYFEHVAW